MLWTLAVVLIILRALGLDERYPMSGLMHMLLLIAITMAAGFLKGAERVGCSRS